MYKSLALGSFIIFILSIFLYIFSWFIPVRLYDFYFYTDNKALANILYQKYLDYVKSEQIKGEKYKYLNVSYLEEKNVVIVKEDQTKAVLAIFDKDYDFLVKLKNEFNKMGYPSNVIELENEIYMLYFNRLYPVVKKLDDIDVMIDKIRNYLNNDDIKGLSEYFSNYVEAKYVKDLVMLEKKAWKKGLVLALSYYASSYKKDLYIVKVSNFIYGYEAKENIRVINEIYSIALKSNKPLYYKAVWKLNVSPLNKLEKELKNSDNKAKNKVKK